MLTYNKLKKKERSLRAFTGLSIKEFESLHLELLPVWLDRFQRDDRKRKPGGGRKSHLPSFADELLLLLIFYRLYPIYEVLGYLFDLDISNVGRHIAYLEKLFAHLARKELRKPPGMAKIRSLPELLEKYPELEEVIIDATEQNVERPKKKAKQKKHYSGKKKRHTLKTQIIVQKKDQKIYDVSSAYPGHMHDKTLLEKERSPDKLPRPSLVRADNAYQKIQEEFPGHNFILPEKANRWHKLTAGQKKSNKKKAKERIGIEHVIGRLKCFKVLSYKYRHDTSKHNRMFKNVCGLYNFRLSLAAAS